MISRKRTLLPYEKFTFVPSCYYPPKEITILIPITSNEFYVVDFYISSYVWYVFCCTHAMAQWWCNCSSFIFIAVEYFITWIYQSSFIPTFDGQGLLPIFGFYSSCMYFGQISILFYLGLNKYLGMDMLG